MRAQVFHNCGRWALDVSEAPAGVAAEGAPRIRNKTVNLGSSDVKSLIGKNFLKTLPASEGKGSRGHVTVLPHDPSESE